jgi:4,5-dihydroxyphthalate decarboxylase
MYRRVMEITGDDPLPYGLQPNRRIVEELIGHAVSQQVLARPPVVEDLFPESTHDLTA